MLHKLAVGILFGLLICIVCATSYDNAHYVPVKVSMNKLNWEDYNCSFGEGYYHPNNPLGLSLLKIAEEQYAAHPDNSTPGKKKKHFHCKKKLK